MEAGRKGLTHYLGRQENQSCQMVKGFVGEYASPKRRRYVFRIGPGGESKESTAL